MIKGTTSIVEAIPEDKTPFFFGCGYIPHVEHISRPVDVARGRDLNWVFVDKFVDPLSECLEVMFSVLELCSTSGHRSSHMQMVRPGTSVCAVIKSAETRDVPRASWSRRWLTQSAYSKVRTRPARRSARVRLA